MEVITISTKAFQAIIDRIDQISHKLDTQNPQPVLNEVWIDIQEACFLLKISKRTLQKYRSEGMLPYSQINGKIYFKAKDIENHLENNYKKFRR